MVGSTRACDVGTTGSVIIGATLRLVRRATRSINVSKCFRTHTQRDKGQRTCPLRPPGASVGKESLARFDAPLVERLAASGFQVAVEVNDYET